MTVEKTKYYRLSCGFASALMAAGLFFILLNKSGFLLCHLEQRQIFLFSGAYFSDICGRAGGFTVYLANFLTQFMFSPTSGAAVATLCVLISGAFLYVSLRRFRWSGPWMFPVCIILCALPLILLWHSYGFEVMAVTMAGTAFAAAYSLCRMKKGWLKTSVWLLSLVLFFVLFGPASYRYEDGGKRQNARYYNLEYLTNQGKWDEIVSLTGKNPLNFTELNYLNLALSMKGVLSDSLLFYPQRGPLSLLNTKDGRDELSMMTMAHILYQAGDYAGAQSMAFSVAVDRYHSLRYPDMVRIVRDVDLIRGSGKTASRYDEMFRKTFHYRGWADIYDIGGSERQSFDVPDYFALFKTPYEDLTAILDAAPENVIASQYAASFAVLTKDIRIIRKVVERYFDSPVLKGRLPRPMAEALLFYSDYYGSLDREFAVSHGMEEEEFNYMKELDSDFCNRYGVSDQVTADYLRFKNLFDRYGTGAPSSAYYEFRNTFWYYLLFVKI